MREIGYQTFCDTFQHLNTPENMKIYTDRAFDIEKLRGELSDPNSTFHFLYVDEILAGYFKMNEGDSQTGIKDSSSLELERIYVKKEFQGQGLGKVLINQGMEIARSKKKKTVWLGVWEKNENAIGFYEKMGFRKVSTHYFYMGDDKQIDYVMTMDLLL